MDRQGFTLIEVVLLIVILALLAAVMYPRGDITGMRAAAVARKIVSDIRYAQQLANTTQIRSGVALTAGSYTLFTNNSSAAPATDPFKGGSYIVNMTGDFAGVSLAWAGISSGIVRFDSLGVPYEGADGAQTPLAAAGSINVQVGATVVKRITVAPTTGQITMN